ncbi:hypothetical protein [Chitinophaga sp. sic0106]|uniref:hypothetical protein n=1 Tax=Chitinophaga sp. sic0106 TaxID=2854785 RepID=UPI001C48BB6F|nr:hypothetical protein [Chitinophaga sp. sic0106]MBV7533312.1 hypothetical protein [Chitinophaga sp. sic0106]
MIKYLLALALPVLLTACTSHRGKYTTPRLQAITIHGENSPWISFSYNKDGQMTSLTKHPNTTDTNTIRFEYDHLNRLTGMRCETTSRNKVTVTKTAAVKDWDLRGNIKEVDFFDGDKQHVRTARIQWQNDQPLSLKYTDLKQATSWDYIEGNPTWKNIAKDPQEDTTIYFTKASCDWDNSYNPLARLANQLLLADTIPQGHASEPLPDLANLLLHVSFNNPSRIQLDEKQETVTQQGVMALSRSTTVQYMYACNGNGYPRSANVYLHTKGYTQLNNTCNTVVDYSYE